MCESVKSRESIVCKWGRPINHLSYKRQLHAAREGWIEPTVLMHELRAGSLRCANEEFFSTFGIVKLQERVIKQLTNGRTYKQGARTHFLNWYIHITDEQLS